MIAIGVFLAGDPLRQVPPKAGGTEKMGSNQTPVTLHAPCVTLSITPFVTLSITPFVTLSEREGSQGMLR